jgi:hypothetical protein
VMSAPGARVMIGSPAKEQPLPIRKPRHRNHKGAITRSIVRRAAVRGLRRIRRRCRRNCHRASTVRSYRSDPVVAEQHSLRSDSVTVLSGEQEEVSVLPLWCLSCVPGLATLAVAHAHRRYRLGRMQIFRKHL